MASIVTSESLVDMHNFCLASFFLPCRNYSERIRSLQTLLRYVYDVVQGNTIGVFSVVNFEFESVVNNVPWCQGINFYIARRGKVVTENIWRR